jgi:hypothetical protein
VRLAYGTARARTIEIEPHGARYESLAAELERATR